MIDAFRFLNFKELIVQNEFMMKNLFADIFKSLLFGLKDSPPFFLINLIVEYVEICFNMAKTEDIDSVLRITVHFLRNIENKPENKPFFERILAKVVQSSAKLTKMIEDDTTEFFLEIIEEFLIIGINSPNFDFHAYLIQLYTSLSKTMANVIPIETIFKLKASIFSVLTTLLLLSLESNTYKLSNFEVISIVLH